MSNQLLESIWNQRITVVGTVKKFEYRTLECGFHKGETVRGIIFSNIIRDNGDPVIVSQWFVIGKQFERLNLKVGDCLKFNVRVVKYEERDGWDSIKQKPLPGRVFYKLSHPSKAEKVVRNKDKEVAVK
jgi:hypothetical protein